MKVKPELISFKPIACLLFIFLVKSGFSQTNIINKTLVSPDSNVLYIGITNSIEIKNNNNPFFQITGMKSTLTSTAYPFIFELRAMNPGWDTLSLSDGNQVFFKKAFRIDLLPPVQAKLGTLRVDEADVEHIVINGWLVLIIPNCKCTVPFTVSSFEVEFESDDVNEEAIKIDGDRLTLQVKKIIKLLKPGDVVWFTHIIAKNEEGKSRDVPDFSITVK